MFDAAIENLIQILFSAMVAKMVSLKRIKGVFRLFRYIGSAGDEKVREAVFNG